MAKSVSAARDGFACGTSRLCRDCGLAGAQLYTAGVISRGRVCVGCVTDTCNLCQPVWPGGKAFRLVGRGTSVRFHFGSCGRSYAGL